MMITLPNEWYTNLDRTELRHRVDTMAKLIAGDREHQWAIHWNKDRTNFHVHVIFSERQKIKDPGRWDRDVYLSVDGKVARRKADRARLDDGTFLPPIHRKGDLKAPFTAKDPKFSTKKWLHECKQEIRQTMIEQWGVKFERHPPLHEFHEGNGSDAPSIRMKNIVVRENNYRLDVLEQQGMRTAQLVKDLKAILKDGKVPLLLMDNKQQARIVTFDSPDRAVWRIDESRGRFTALDQPVPAQTAQEQQPVEPEHKPVEVAQEEPERVTPPPDPEKPPERSDKKEVEKEPAAPVERRGLIDLIRDLIASIAAQRAARASQKAAAEQQRKDAAEQARAAVLEPQQPAPEPERKPKLDDRIAEFEKQRTSMDNWNSQIADQRVRERTRNQTNVPDRNQKPRSHDHDGR